MRMPTIAPALLALAFCFPASAVDVQNYLRANAAANSEGGGQTCFALAGAGAKYRLGNECGVYGEMLLGQHLGCRHERRLSAVAHRDEAGGGGHDRFARADFAL